MKYLRLILIFIAFLFLLNSCSTILGIKSPKKISKQEVLHYLLKHDIDTSNIIYLQENYLDTLKKYPFKPNWEEGFRPIQCKLFDSTGKLIFQYSSCEGYLKQTGIYDKFPPDNITPIDSKYTLSDEKILIKDSIPKMNKSEYIAIIYWATYTGIPGRNFIKNIVKTLNSKSENILIMKLNTDEIEYE